MTETHETHARHFVVTGEAITQIARDMLLSEMPAKAWRLLAQNLIGGKPGEAEATASAVLDGEKKLIGDSNEGIDVEDDRESQNYVKTLRYIYAGRIRIDGRWYQPEARVVSFNERDGKYATDKLGCCPSKLSHEFERWALYRVEFYGNGRGRAVDISKTARPKRKRRGDRNPTAEVDVILFRECTEPPHWWPEPSTAADAYDQFIAGGRSLTEIDPAQGVRLGENEDPDYEATMTSEDGTNRVRPFIVERAARERKEQIAFEQEAEEEEEAQRIALQLATYRKYGDEVRARANGDFIEITLPEGYVPMMEDDTPSLMFANRTIKVPRAPFECWSLWRTHLNHLKPEWQCVAPSGLKMTMDDPYHTDWMLGADIHLRHSYDTSITSAALDMMGVVQKKYGQFQHTVIVSASDCNGIVGDPTSIGAIMVLRDLRNTPENNLAVSNARAIITETGGELAHVATLARENKIPVFRVPNAVKLFPVGMKLTLCPGKGKIYSSGYEVEAEDD